MLNDELPAIVGRMTAHRVCSRLRESTSMNWATSVSVPGIIMIARIAVKIVSLNGNLNRTKANAPSELSASVPNTLANARIKVFRNRLLTISHANS